jgi:hypothetical protein
MAFHSTDDHNRGNGALSVTCQQIRSSNDSVREDLAGTELTSPSIHTTQIMVHQMTVW